MALHLVTGYKGSAHVTSADQAWFNAGVAGGGDYVFNIGNKFNASIINNNVVRILSGSLLMQGRHVVLTEYQDVNIASGTASMNRHDLIVMRYTRDVTTGVESANLVVIQGTPTAGTATDPTPSDGDILFNNENTGDMRLYRVVLQGFDIVKVEPLFSVVAPIGEIYKNTQPQNMLVNGDFQCNQRGQKTYGADGAVGYTVDMWRAYKVKVDVLNEGVKLTGLSTTEQGYFTQFIQLGALREVFHTISAMVDGKVYTFTTIAGASAKGQDFGKFTISVLSISVWDNDLNAYNSKLKVSICPNGTNEITVKYVDVVEGQVAFPHVKEDYPTALMRCEKYIKKKGYVSPLFVNNSATINTDSSTHYNAVKFYIPFDTMACKFNAYLTPPRVESISWGFVAEGTLDVVTGTKLCSEDTVHVIKNASGVEEFTLCKCQIPKVSGKYQTVSTKSFGIKGAYVVSCEYNPDGD